MSERWYSADISEIEKKLKTNAASGLSVKSARARAKREGQRFFITPKKPLGSMALNMLSDFALVLLIISAAVALCFDEVIIGVGIGIAVAVNLLATTVIYIRSQRLFESVEIFFHPSVTVIRGGKAYSIDAQSVAVGDVVLLSEGDVLSFDARLVTSDKLKVDVRLDRRTVEECDKQANGIISDRENDIRKMVNMVHAGSVVKAGSARAIVTAVGRYTYYGAMTGGVLLPVSNKLPHGLGLLKKYCSGLSFALTVAILPFSILCLLFSSEKVTLLTAFTSVLSIAASSMAGISCTACRVFFERQARRSIEAKNPSVLRSPDVMDKLLSCEYVFLLDGSAVSDGVLHYERAICADGESGEDGAISRSLANLAELAALYDSAERKTLTVGIHSPGRFLAALSEFAEFTGVDSEALAIRCSVTGYAPGNLTDKTDKLFYLDGNIRYILNVSGSESAINNCNRAFVSGGVSPISESGKQRLIERCKGYVNEGKRILVFTLSDNVSAENFGRSIFAGILVLSQKTDPSFRYALSALAKNGIKTISFVGTAGQEGKEHTDIAAPVLGRKVSRFDFERIDQPITYKFGEISTYSELCADQIGELIKYVHSQEKRVAAVCFSGLYEQISEEADVFVSCSALQYRFKGRFEQEIEALEVGGSAESVSCRQDVKSSADVIRPRPSNDRGGLMSLCYAIRASGSAYSNLVGFFKYVLCTQFVRMVMVLIPMIFGEAHLDARHALFCGFIIDIFALAVFACERYGAERPGYRKRLAGEFRRPVRTNAGMITAAAVGGILALVLPYFIGSLDIMGRYLYETEYLFVSMILLHITVMFCVIFNNVKRYGMTAVSRTPIYLFAFCGVFLALCFVFDPLGALFDVSEISLPYLLLTLVPSAACAFLFFLIGDFGIRADKK